MNTEAHAASPTELKNEVERLHVVCQVLRTKALKDKGQLELRWSLRGSFFPAYPINVTALEIAIKKSRDTINRIVSHIADQPDSLGDPSLPATQGQPALNALFAELAEAGYEIHNILLPSTNENQAVSVAGWLAGLVREDRLGSLEIQIEDQCEVTQDGPMPAVPWNLVYDSYVDVDEIAEAFATDPAATWSRFWGVRFDLSCGQNVNPLKADHRIDPKSARAVIVMDEVIGNRLLASDPDKTAFEQLIARINAIGADQTDDEGSKPAGQNATPVVTVLHDAKELKRYVRKNGLPNLLYWLSHARPDALYLEFADQAQPSQEIKLYDLEQILQTPDAQSDAPGSVPSAPRKLIAFLNGCQTSEASESGSFLRSFTRFDQVSGLISTEQETLDVFAHHFGMKFLASFFLERKPLGEILRDLRRETLPLGLLYGTYCPPTIRLVEPSKSRQPEPIPVKMSNYLGESLRKLSAATLTPGPAVRIKPPRQITPLQWPEKPYPSLGFYTLKDQALFLGRDDDSARLAEMVDSPNVRLLLLHGTSGSGKSSVIRAGLVPWLEKYAVGYRFLRRPESEGSDGIEQLHLFFRPSNDFAGRLASDLMAFTEKLLPLEPRPDGSAQDPVPLRPVLATCLDPARTDITYAELKAAFKDTNQPDLLCRILDALTDAIPEKLVISIDQAEELYTLAQGDTPEEIRQAEDRRTQAFALLRECLRGSGRWKVILSYRTEYHGRITDGIRSGLRKTPGLVDYLITDLNKSQLRQVIERPTLDFHVIEELKETPREKYRFTFEPGVIDAIVDGIFRLRGRNTDSVLPIAQVVCTRLYEQARTTSGTDQLAVVRKADLDRLRHRRKLGQGVGADLIGNPDSPDFERLPRFYRDWLSRREQAIAAATTKDAGGEGPVLEILEDFAASTLEAVAKGDSQTGQNLKSLMMRLYLTQPDGTLTTAQMDKTQAQKRFWSGSEASFDTALDHAAKSRLLRVETATGTHETEEATIRLGHDTLCKVAGRWDAAEQARRRVRKFQIGAIVAASVCGLMGLLYASAEKAKTEAILAKQDAVINEARAIEEKKNAEKQTKLAEAQRIIAEAEKARAETLAVNSDLLLAANLFEQGNDIEILKKLFAIPEKNRTFDWGLLKNQLSDRSSALTSNHSGAVNSVAWSSKGNHVASGSDDMTIKIWEAGSGRIVRTLEGHTDSVTIVVFSQDGKSLASGSADNTIRIWDVATGQTLQTLTGHKSKLNSLAISSDGRKVASGYSDNTIRLLDVNSDQKLLESSTLSGHEAGVVCLVFLKDGMLASGSSDGTVRLWDIQTGKAVRSINGPRSAIFSLAVSPDGQRLATGAADHTIRIWDTSTGELIGLPLTHHKGPVTSVSYSPDGRTLASGSTDAMIQFWDVVSGKPYGKPLTGHKDSILSLAFSPDGRSLASASADYTIRFWELATGLERRTVASHQDDVTTVAFSPDGRTLASGSIDDTIRIWDVITGHEMRLISGPWRSVWCVAFSPNGETLAAGTGDNAIRIWNLKTGKQIQTLSGHKGGVASIAFSPDNRTLASGSADNTIRLWDLVTGLEIAKATENQHPVSTPLGEGPNYVSTVAFSPDGQTLASGAHDGTIRLFNFATGHEIRQLLGHRFRIMSLVFSPDGRTLASGGMDGTIWLWDMETGREKRVLSVNKGIVWSVAFSPDGQTLASGSEDNAMRLWDVRTGQEIRTLTSHRGPIRALAFSSDGEMLASGSSDHTIRLWNVPTSFENRTLVSHQLLGDSLAISPDGRKLASITTDNKIQICDVVTGQIIMKLSRHHETLRSLAFSSDGNSLVSVSTGNKIRLSDVATGKDMVIAPGLPNRSWGGVLSPDAQTLALMSMDDNTIPICDVGTGQKTQVLPGRLYLDSSVAFQVDQRLLAAGSSGYTIQLWDLAKGEKIRTFSGHRSIVSTVAFSPDGRWLASGSWDNTIRIWDVATGQEIRTLLGHQNRVLSVGFTPDGRTLASGSNDNTIRLWDLATGQELRRLNLSSSATWVAFAPAASGRPGTFKLAAATGNDVLLFESQINDIDALTRQDERIARNFLRFYPLYDETIAAILRNETLTDEDKDRIAGIIQPLIDFQKARAAANAIPLPENVFQP